MTTNTDFTIWCARKCLHLWNAPDLVKEWLKDPRPETAIEAWKAAQAEWSVDAESAEAIAIAVEAAADAAWPVPANAAVVIIDAAAVYATKALHTTLTDLKLEYVKTWTEDELGKADDEWIEVATVEILDRE